MNTKYFRKQLSDKVSICLSLCCIIHCIALHLLILMIPSLSSFWINSENVHILLVILAVPISLLAMGKSLRIHHNYKCILLAGIGLILLILAIFMHDLNFGLENEHHEHSHDDHGGLGETLETIFTVIGGGILLSAHFLNMKYANKLS